MARIIALMGIDGSGKTTQARLLYAALSRQGFKAKIVYAGNTGFRLAAKRSFYLSLPIDLIIHKLLHIRDISNSSRHQSLFKIEALLLFLNYIALVLPKIFFYGMMYQVIIADRYVYDYVFQHVVFGQAVSESVSRADSILMRVTPKPDMMVVLDLDENIAYNRKREDKSIEELRILRRLYLLLVDELGGICVDASKPARTVFNEVLKAVGTGWHEV